MFFLYGNSPTEHFKKSFPTSCSTRIKFKAIFQPGGGGGGGICYGSSGGDCFHSTCLDLSVCLYNSQRAITCSGPKELLNYPVGALVESRQLGLDEERKKMRKKPSHNQEPIVDAVGSVQCRCSRLMKARGGGDGATEGYLSQFLDKIFPTISD